MQETKNGGIIIKCVTVEDMEKLRHDGQDKLSKDYDIETTKLRKPKIKIIGYYGRSNAAEIEHQIRKQNNFEDDDYIKVTYIRNSQNRGGTIYAKTLPRAFKKRLVENFGQTGSLANKSTHVHRRGAQSEVNIAAVSQSVKDDPNLSIPRRSQELGLSQTTTWIILHQDLHLKPYKVQITQELKANDHHLRQNFANWALERVVANWVFRMHSVRQVEEDI
ncbi:hypothetical protein NQ317_012225 [Molorchus minor]|uniref:Uncharacterized protein n=1 Tax=Molorchus minor TaxID=1323400 RepID=A0ABQ9JHC4_9CUCU|nr:hypothetical protein NQ317_012225 [Molorchus minor]